MGTTKNPEVNLSLKVVVAVCGELFEYAAEDPDELLITQLA